MSTALADRPIVVEDEQLALIKRTVAQGATDDELKLFLYDCKRRNVHPLDKLLHFTKRGGRYTPVTSIDFMRSRAADTGELAGSDDAIFVEDESKLLSATVTVYRITQGQRYPYTATARWAEYCPDNAPMWRKMPRTMLGKCAEALALRKAFPQQLAGLYTTDEMEQAGRNGPPPLVVEPEQPLPEPPEGACWIRRIDSQHKGNREWAEVTIHTGEILIAPGKQLVALLEQIAQEKVPAVLTIVENAKGKQEITKAERWKEPQPEQPAAEPVVEKIPF